MQTPAGTGFARIDRLRGLVPRETYARDVLDKALKRQEWKARKS